MTALFGIQWWRLRRDRQKLEQTRRAIAGMLKQEIGRITSKPTARPELRKSRADCLAALAKPFKTRQLADEEAWRAVMENVGQCFDHLMRTTQEVSEPGHPSVLDASDDTDGLSTAELDSGIDSLLTGYQAGKSAIETNREATAELKRNYQQLQLANRNLRHKLQLDKNSDLWQLFETYERNNAVFMKTLSVKERSYNLLVKEFEALRESLQHLQAIIGNYRKSVHKLLLERSGLAEENKQLREQHEVTDRLVTRLNRNYDTLRNEYTKLFETIR
ncbi:hypothetical protein [Thiocystis violascens]|uniref:hypothetical protein n=1 Tax=Thiocystis violascens TaxID=73141 RepID=UPI0012F66EBF|nr:hypothetical protein [Thiocystis violascens]